MRDGRAWRSVVDVGCLAIFAASLAGGICGTTLIAGWVLSKAPEGLSLISLLQIPLVGIFYGFVVSPVVGFGLVLFGIPLTRLIGDSLTSRSGWILASVASTVSGVIFLTMLSALFGPLKFNQEWLLWSTVFSLPYSVPAGLVWLIVIRRNVLGPQR